VKVGDLVLAEDGQTAILMTEPRLYDTNIDEDDPYYVAEVYLTEFGCKDVWITDDLEIISEGS
tara:strand:- start:546 stop:734 length:189 start_codon:yes stop_codon:yes gene_type:complete